MCRIVVGEGHGGLSEEEGHEAVSGSGGCTRSRSVCVCPQASFLGDRVQCYAHHLLRISGAGCNVPVLASQLAPHPGLEPTLQGGWGHPGRKDRVGALGLVLGFVPKVSPSGNRGRGYFPP